MTNGVFSGAVFPKDTGIACERQFEAGGLEAAIGDPLAIEGKPFPGLAVGSLGFRVKNRSDHVTRFHPRSAVAFDEFPARSSNTMIAPNVPEGAFWESQAERRRRILARSNIAYIPHFSGEPQPTADDLALARQYVRDVQEGRVALPDEPESENPLTRTTYEESMTRSMGASYDPTTGVGVRVKET